MATYNAQQLHTSFEILSRSGRMKEVMQRLADSDFSLRISDEHANAVAAELKSALEHLESTDPEAHAALIADRQEHLLKGSSDCPCRSN